MCRFTVPNRGIFFLKTASFFCDPQPRCVGLPYPFGGTFFFNGCFFFGIVRSSDGELIQPKIEFVCLRHKYLCPMSPSPYYGPGPMTWAGACNMGRARAHGTHRPLGPGPGPCPKRAPHFGPESGRRRSSGRFQRAFGVILRCGSEGTILGTSKSVFCWFYYAG